MAEAEPTAATVGRQPINLICKACGETFPLLRKAGTPGRYPHRCEPCRSWLPELSVSAHQGYRPSGARSEGRCKRCGCAIPKVAGCKARWCCDPCKAARIKEREGLRVERDRRRRPPKQCQDCGVVIGNWKAGGNVTRCEGCAIKARRAARERENTKRRRGEPLTVIMARVAERRARLKVELLERQARRALDRASKPWMAPGLTDAQQYASRYQNDPEFRARERERAYRSERRKTKPLETALRYVLVRNGANSSKLELISCTVEDLRRHIEGQFRRGMTWDAFRVGRIHIAHVTRLSQFDLDQPSDVTKAWTLSNLRPMWARDNLRLCRAPVLGVDD